VLEFAGSVLRVVKASLAPPLCLVTDPVENPLSIPLQDMDLGHINVGKLLDDTELADVTFAVDGQRFPAHRCVLIARRLNPGCFCAKSWLTTEEIPYGGEGNRIRALKRGLSWHVQVVQRHARGRGSAA